MIELKSVDQKYGGTQILWDLDLKIEKGSRTCIMDVTVWVKLPC